MAEMSLEQGLGVLDKRTRTVRGVLFIYIAMSLLSIIADFAGVAGMVDVEADVLDTPSLIAVLAYTALAISALASAVLVAMWIYRAHANLHAADIPGLEFTPGWAVGWYFIPIASLFIPFRAMRELWNSCCRGAENHGVNPDFVLRAWWGTWITGNILSTLSWRLLEGDKGLILDSASTILLLVATWFLLQIVLAVNAAQNPTMGLNETFA